MSTAPRTAYFLSDAQITAIHASAGGKPLSAYSPHTDVRQIPHPVAFVRCPAPSGGFVNRAIEKHEIFPMHALQEKLKQYNAWGGGSAAKLIHGFDAIRYPGMDAADFWRTRDMLREIPGWTAPPLDDPAGAPHEPPRPPPRYPLGLNGSSDTAARAQKAALLNQLRTALYAAPTFEQQVAVLRAHGLDIAAMRMPESAGWRDGLPLH